MPADIGKFHPHLDLFHAVQDRGNDFKAILYLVAAYMLLIGIRGVRSPLAVYRELLINSPAHSTLVH